MLRVLLTVLIVLLTSLPSYSQRTQLMQEDISYVNPLRYGIALNSTTLNTAITAIGSSKRTLFLNTGNWVLSANVTVPSTISLVIPSGTTVTVSGGFTLTLNGRYFSYQKDWYTGTVVFNNIPFSEPEAFNTAFNNYIVSGGIHTTSGSLTSPSFSTSAWIRGYNITEPARTLTYVTAANDVVWVIIGSVNTGIAGWTQIGSTHYYYKAEGDTTPNEPPLPENSNWLMGPITITSSAIAAVTDKRVPLSYAQRGVYDVTDQLFGATGDGATNDAAAIQAALNRTGNIFLPRGTYITGSTTLVVKNNSIVSGIGPSSVGGSLISYSGTGDGIQINNPVNASTGAYITLKDFSIQCTGAAVATKGCIADTGSSYLIIDNVRVSGNWAGIILDQTEISNIANSTIEASVVVGLWLVNGNAHNAAASQYFTNQISVSNTQFNRVALANTFAIVNDGGTDHEFKNNNFNGWGTWLRLASQTNMKYTNNEFEGAIDASPVTFNATTSVNGQAVTAGAVTTFDSNIFSDTSAVNTIEILAAASQNTLNLFGNTMINSGTAKIKGAAYLSSLNVIGNYIPDNLVYDAIPAAGGVVLTSLLEYVSGTWTPTGNTGIVLTVTSATYIRIGNKVTVQFDVTWPVTADAGQALIAGLPFAPAATWLSLGNALIVSTTTVQPFYGDSASNIKLITSAVGIKTNVSMSTLRVVGSYTYFR